jgi:hypothetical protein
MKVEAVSQDCFHCLMSIKFDINYERDKLIQVMLVRMIDAQVRLGLQEIFNELMIVTSRSRALTEEGDDGGDVLVMSAKKESSVEGMKANGVSSNYAKLSMLNSLASEEAQAIKLFMFITESQQRNAVVVNDDDDDDGDGDDKSSRWFYKSGDINISISSQAIDHLNAILMQEQASLLQSRLSSEPQVDITNITIANAFANVLGSILVSSLGKVITLALIGRNRLLMESLTIDFYRKLHAKND